jgi:glucose-6-phosphate isomerase
VHLSLYHDDPESGAFAQHFLANHTLARLRTLDSRARRHGLDSLDPSRNLLIPIGMEVDAAGKVTKNGYGVFNLSWQGSQHLEWPETVSSELAGIRAGIKEGHGVPLRFLIWAGMGGSAEDKSMYNSAGLLKKGPRCYVLDSTDPAKLAAILEDIRKRSRAGLGESLKRTLVVGMAMGMTSYEPVVNLEKLAKLYDACGIDSRPNFIYMTLPDSLLDQFASKRGYRRIELQLDNANSTAGRHSGPLTRGSLYPLGLCGVDLGRWIGATALSDEQIATAWKLAAFLHAQGTAGRDKVTLALPKTWAGAALWTKQDFEESLGKSEELGIKIVIGERIKMPNYRAPRDPEQDRVFLAVQMKGESSPDAPKIALLRRAGYPVAVLALPSGAALSAYMQFIHYAVFGIAYLRKMNFVTQPGVELYKAITNRLHAEAATAGGIEHCQQWKAFTETPCQTHWRNRVTLRYQHADVPVAPNEGTAPAVYAALIRNAFENGAQYGELSFFGDMRYAKPGAAMRRVLDRAAETVFRSRLKAPVDVYEGPAMNHSYHEMIIGHGHAFSTVLLSERAASLPEAEYTAGYHQAQFLATQMALAERHRPVVSVTVKDLEPASLAALDEFFRQTARYLSITPATGRAAFGPPCPQPERPPSPAG